MVRRAVPDDGQAVSEIYNAAILGRASTFEVSLTSAEQMQQRIIRTRAEHAFLVAVDAGGVLGWAATMPYALREVYRGVAEFSIFVESASRGVGVGRLLLAALLDEAEDAGLHKVTSRVFVDNSGSRGLCRALGFREVGVHLRHGRLDGDWRDVVTVERLLGVAAVQPAIGMRGAGAMGSPPPDAPPRGAG